MKKITFLSILAMVCCVLGCSAQTDKFVTKSGKEVVITPIKHASMRISYNNLEIQVDPVIALEPKTDYTAMPKADIILVTHEHFDHLDKEAINQLQKESTIIIANPNSANILGKGEIMKNGDTKSILTDITVNAVPAYNISPDKQQFHPKGRDNGYILTIDGLRIYIAGDTEDIPEMADVKDIDIAFLPCNLPFTMTPEQVAKAANIIKPKVLYPYHYGKTQIERVPELLKESNIDVRIRNYQ